MKPQVDHGIEVNMDPEMFEHLQRRELQRCLRFIFDFMGENMLPEIRAEPTYLADDVDFPIRLIVRLEMGEKNE